MKALVLEYRDQPDRSGTIHSGNSTLLTAPPVDEEYWAYRVRLTGDQSIVGFPKFTTVGIGFSKEDDWNTNLPYSAPAEDIFEHIKHNKGSRAISDEDCLEAIRMVQAAVKRDRAVKRIRGE